MWQLEKGNLTSQLESAKQHAATSQKEHELRAGELEDAGELASTKYAALLPRVKGFTILLQAFAETVTNLESRVQTVEAGIQGNVSLQNHYVVKCNELRELWRQAQVSEDENTQKQERIEELQNDLHHADSQWRAERNDLVGEKSVLERRVAGFEGEFSDNKMKSELEYRRLQSTIDRQEEELQSMEAQHTKATEASSVQVRNLKHEADQLRRRASGHAMQDQAHQTANAKLREQLKNEETKNQVLKKEVLEKTANAREYAQEAQKLREDVDYHREELITQRYEAIAAQAVAEGKLVSLARAREDEEWALILERHEQLMAE